MDQMTYNQYLAFMQGCSVGQVEVTGIRNPQSTSNYDGKSLQDQQRQFILDANGVDNPQPIEVQVQDLLGGSKAGDQSDWLAPSAVGAWITNERN